MNITRRAVHICNKISKGIISKRHWIKTHPQEVTDRLMAFGTAMNPIASLISIKVDIDSRKDEYLHYKDPTTNVTFELVRPLTNEEGKEIAKLVRDGSRPVEDYLEELKIIK